MTIRKLGLWCTHIPIPAHPCVPVAFSQCLYTWHSILPDVVAISFNQSIIELRIRAPCIFFPTSGGAIEGHKPVLVLGASVQYHAPQILVGSRNHPQIDCTVRLPP